MVAYSFKKRFIVPISLGLGIAYQVDDIVEVGQGPKRQTIRAVGRRHHAKPGGEVQLYTAMRTKQCRLIGKSVCEAVTPIFIKVDRCGHVVLNPESKRPKRRTIETVGELDDFARADGFLHWVAMVEFWEEEHPGIKNFTGLLIQWRGL